MMARIIDTAPETEAIDIDVRSRWEEPAPFAFCSGLALFVVEAAQRGQTDLALRIVNELNDGLTSGDDWAASCVSIGFLEPQVEWREDSEEWLEKPGFRSEGMGEFVARWPPQIKAELRRQVAHEEKVRRKEEGLWLSEPQQPDGWKLPLRWKLRHPILWWKARDGSIHSAG